MNVSIRCKNGHCRKSSKCAEKGHSRNKTVRRNYPGEQMSGGGGDGGRYMRKGIESNGGIKNRHG